MLLPDILSAAVIPSALEAQQHVSVMPSVMHLVTAVLILLKHVQKVRKTFFSVVT